MCSFAATGCRAPVPAEEDDHARPLRARPTVLLADDYASLRAIMRLALEDAGFDVIEAGDGGEAVDLIQAHVERVALMVMDVEMPKVDGVAALHTVRRMGVRQPALICSGLPAETLSLRFHGVEVSGFLTKPFAASELVAAVRRLTFHPLS